MNSFILPVTAVLIGVLIAIITKKQSSKSIKLLLSFSGAFLLALTLFDLLPETYQHVKAKQTGLLIMLGILLQIILEFFSKGAEHGHIHIKSNKNLFPWALFISLCLHSFLEGFPIHGHNSMVYGVFIHKIPIATLITAFLIQSDFSVVKITCFLVFFSIMTPLGTYVSNVTLIDSQYIFLINALVIGIFLHISTTILFESGDGHKFNLSKLIAIAMGIGIAYLL